ncbi:hypothetical protein ES288_A06G082700v1 [Gossypium darwinii]|uniref:Uncharacterized protein n=1 Tax=Gossypium darwinii TaxID=34276 RepID=A0A5D2G6F0_GOSDA|nr:hypothetical protein ES288_A06G082700v1 [Gossypium darwinii]
MALENNLIGCEVRRYNALLTVILHRIPVSTCLRNLRLILNHKLRDGDARQKGSWDPRAEEFDQRQIKNGRSQSPPPPKMDSTQSDEIKRHSDDKN